MTIYAVADEQDSYYRYIIRPNSAFSATTKDTNARTAGITSGRVPALLRWSTGLSEVYVNVLSSFGAPATSNAILFALRNQSSGNRIFDVINGSSGSALTVRYNLSGTMTDIAAVNLQGSARSNTSRYTLYFRRGSSGAIRLYYKGTLISEYTGNFSTPDTTMDELLIGGLNPTETFRPISVIVSDDLRIDTRLNTLVPNGTGNSSDWTGDWNQLAAAGEQGTGSANIFAPVHTNSINQKLLSAFGDIPTVLANHSIQAVAVSAMGALDSGSGVSSVSFLARQSSTDYTLNSMGLVAGDGFRGSQQILHTTPAGGAWTESDLNAMQFGMVSA